jgi:hypothetical protein
MEVEHLTGESLSQRIQRVLKDPSYINRAQYFRRIIAETRD